MDKLRVKLLAFANADQAVFNRGKKRLLKLFEQEKVEFVDNKPDILVFLTGGSERAAINLLQEYRYYPMFASRDENSWAAASEVKAWMAQNHITSTLRDIDDPKSVDLVRDFHMIKNGLKRLQGQRLGMVGTPSDWLVASLVSPFILQSRFGVETVEIPWASVPLSEVSAVGGDFVSFFSSEEHKEELLQSGRLYEALTQAVKVEKLSALSVECFSLVNSCNLTACLALAKLSMDGIPAGCEGDMCSAIGMMISKEVCGVIPWMANIAHVDGDKALFAHCTAPANLYEKFHLDTHFETNKGLALGGDIKGEKVTVFRFDSTLNKMFVTLAKVTGHPKSKMACRTQLEVHLTPEAQRYFVENPLGNHHLIIPGDYTQRFALLAMVLNLKLV